ncbi:hypothetical protein JCM10212_002867 [Sporobolomyces blumeae]
MSKKVARPARAASPPVSRQSPVSSKPSRRVRLVACTVALLPLLFPSQAISNLYPLFSSSLAQSTEATVHFYAILAVVFVGQRLLVSRGSNWRLAWLIIGTWKIATEGIVRYGSERFLRLGLDRGVLVGRLLVEGVPQLALANWLVDQFECKERRLFLPSYFLPLGFGSFALLPRPDWLSTVTASLSTCHVLQAQGVLLVSIALFASHPSLHRLPRSSHRHVSSTHPVGPTALRLAIFAAVLAVAHLVAISSSHCPTSRFSLPLSKNTSSILASSHSTTGVIVVGEQEITGPHGKGGYRFRYLRADHSLLGGLWTGPSEIELRAKGKEVTEVEVVRRAESIYSTFILQELVRLVKTPDALPRSSPEQGLIIGLGAGLVARALDAHKVNLTICEIDPIVYDYAKRYFAVPEPAEAVLRDARAWLQATKDGKLFDYVVHDVFTGGAVPAALFTVEFWDLLKTRLHHSAVLAVNFAGSLSSPASRLILSTLVYSFPHCRAFGDNPTRRGADPATKVDESTVQNLVVFCSPSWFGKIEFRSPVESDFLEYPSRQGRRTVFENFERQEVQLDRFKVVRPEEQGGDSDWAAQQRERWILTDQSTGRLEREQLEATREHWKAMEQVLPIETWATW